MIPMNVNFPGGSKARITWGSVIWLGVVTSIGTVIGSYVYAKWVQPYFNPSANSTGTTSGLGRLKSSVFSDRLGRR